MRHINFRTTRHWLAAGFLSLTLAIPGFAQHAGMRGGFSGHGSGGMRVSPGNVAPRVNFGSGFSAPRNFSAPPRYNWNHVAAPPSSFTRGVPFARGVVRQPFTPVRSGIIRPGLTSGYRTPMLPQHRDNNWRGGNGYHRPPYDRGYGRHYDGWHQPYIPNVWARSTYLVGGSLPLSPYPGYWDDSDWSDSFNSQSENYPTAPYANNYSNQSSYAPVESVAAAQPVYSAPDPTPAPPQTSGRAPYRSDEVTETSAVQERPATTLIFKDGSSPIQVHNYAVTRNTLYVYDTQQRIIPVSKLDISATEKANRDVGNDFSLPVMP